MVLAWAYLSKFSVDLGMATGNDLGLEGDSVGKSLFVCEPPNLEHEAIGHILVDHLEMERPRRVQVWHNANVRDRRSRRRGRRRSRRGDIGIRVVGYALAGGGGRNPTG